MTGPSEVRIQKVFRLQADDLIQMLDMDPVPGAFPENMPSVDSGGQFPSNCFRDFGNMDLPKRSNRSGTMSWCPSGMNPKKSW